MTRSMRMPSEGDSEAVLLPPAHREHRVTGSRPDAVFHALRLECNFDGHSPWITCSEQQHGVHIQQWTRTACVLNHHCDLEMEREEQEGSDTFHRRYR